MKATTSQPPKTGSKQITNIQALRGIAALLVFIAHIIGAERDYGGGESLLPHFLHMGESGVDLFFLISGFIMVYVTGSNGHSEDYHKGHGYIQSIQFFYRRAARIYPLYWVLTLGLLVLYAGKKILFAEATPIDNYVSSFLLLPDKQFPIIPVGWTLVHEMYFYIIFSVFLLFHRKYLPLLLCAWGVVVLVGELLDLREINPWFAVVFSPLTFEFLLGAAIAFLALRNIFPSPKILLLFSTLALLIMFIPYADTLYPAWVADHWRRTLLFSLPYGLMLWGAVGFEWTRSICAPSWLVKMGDASYSLYLIHIPMFLVVGKTLSLVSGPGILDNIFLIAVYLVSGVVAALFVHHYIEKPLNKAAKSWSPLNS